MKKLFVIAITAFAFTACNNAGKTPETKGDSATAAAPVATPAPEAAPATPVTPEAAPATPVTPAP
ncbi:MAG: hypothetical protein HQ463_06805 [Bacteroidetes bacterium]|nr:hypothetical protein [Bacteroidota bacterium]